MYYGHIQSGVVVLTGINKSGNGWSANVLYKSSGKTVKKSFTELYTMLQRIPDYQVSYAFKECVNTYNLFNHKLVYLISSHIKSGKCTDYVN